MYLFFSNHRTEETINRVSAAVLQDRGDDQPGQRRCSPERRRQSIASAPPFSRTEETINCVSATVHFFPRSAMPFGFSLTSTIDDVRKTMDFVNTLHPGGIREPMF